jgi:hypothetical protein
VVESEGLDDAGFAFQVGNEDVAVEEHQSGAVVELAEASCPLAAEALLVLEGMQPGVLRQETGSQLPAPGETGRRRDAGSDRHGGDGMGHGVAWLVA